jgi:microcystin-dependent protein
MSNKLLFSDISTSNKVLVWFFLQFMIITKHFSFADTALFSIVGTYYGGNGVKTFGVPNHQNAVSFLYGTGPGLSTYPIGSLGGLVSQQLQIF